MGNAGKGKIELVDRVLKGEPVERPPLSLWYHFGVQHGDGPRFAGLALDYFRHYDLDFLKVMNDYFYPMPEGLDAVRNGADLARAARFDVGDTPWREQFRALEVISAELEGEAYFLDTVFDPWNTLKRALAGENIGDLMDSEPEAVQEALGVITENLIAYCLRSLDIGSAGIFLSIPASREFMSREQFLTFGKPFAYRLLEAVFRRGRMNVAHIHGDDLYFDDCLDFPVHVFNWWDRGPGGPSLAAVKERISGCVMGGIDHKIVTRKTCPFLREHVREGKTLGGKDRFFLANGCSIDASVNPRAIRAIVEAARLSRS
ncbi:MAG: uroporphyrinogen decarboxylase family protein [Candidatus Deferrimicrobiaceae bacterium]